MSIKKENLRELRDIVKNDQGAGKILVITNPGDGDIVRRSLEGIKKQIFREDGEVDIFTHEEMKRRGQWLGLLDACKALKECKGSLGEGGIVLGGMYPGKGTRLSPITQRLHGIKPFFPMLIRNNEKSEWLSGASASLFTFNHAAYHLKRMGFHGIIWKWGDEPQIAATRLKDLDWDLSSVDFVRFGSTQTITENLAVNKEWFKIDEENNMIQQVRRRPRRELLDKLGLDDAPDASAMVHIGSPAFSCLFVEEAMKIFGDWPGWVDVDGYLGDALTLDEKEWKKEAERSKDPDLQYLLKTYPDFYSACRKLKSNISARRNGAPLKIKVVDFGKDLFWGDIGQLSKARDSLHMVAEKTPEGEFARELAAIEKIEPDMFGNVIAGDCLYRQDGSVTDSVLIDTRLYGRSKIKGAVLINSDLEDARIKDGSVVYESAVTGLEMEERAFAFKSVSKKLRIEKEWVHTSMPADLYDINKGLEDWRADSTQNVGSAENYKKPRYGNPRSFEDQQEKMRQREIPPDDIEKEIEEKFVGPLTERMIKS